MNFPHPNVSERNQKIKADYRALRIRGWSKTKCWEHLSGAYFLAQDTIRAIVLPRRRRQPDLAQTQLRRMARYEKLFGKLGEAKSPWTTLSADYPHFFSQGILKVNDEMGHLLDMDSSLKLLRNVRTGDMFIISKIIGRDIYARRARGRRAGLAGKVGDPMLGVG